MFENGTLRNVYKFNVTVKNPYDCSYYSTEVRAKNWSEAMAMCEAMYGENLDSVNEAPPWEQ